jgi:hypothetical protein
MMADGIRFREFLICNTQQNRTIEANAKTLFSYANLHDRSFDDELSDAFASLSASTWNTAGASDYGTWEISSNQLKGTGGGDGDWDHLLSVDDMPAEGVLTIYKNCNRGGIIFRGTDKDDHYLFFWDADSVGFKKCSSGSYSTLVDVPKVFTSEADITVSWREMKFRRTADEKWLFMSAWVDGELAVTTEDDISNSTPGQKIGLAVYDSDIVYFDNIRIPELTEVIDWCSLDIGEAPGGALSRMIGRRHIKYFLRYDSTVRMWRPKSDTSTWTYQRHITRFQWNVDRRNLVGHWRQVGAWEEADRFDTTLLQKGVQRFHKDDNPDLMTKQSCYDEAGYAIQRLKEIADRVSMSVPAQVLQEPEDVVTVYFARDGNTIINSVDYIVDLEQGYTVSYENKKLGSTLHLRKQV